MLSSQSKLDIIFLLKNIANGFRLIVMKFMENGQTMQCRILCDRVTNSNYWKYTPRCPIAMQQNRWDSKSKALVVKRNWPQGNGEWLTGVPFDSLTYYPVDFVDWFPSSNHTPTCSPMSPLIDRPVLIQFLEYDTLPNWLGHAGAQAINECQDEI